MRRRGRALALLAAPLLALALSACVPLPFAGPGGSDHGSAPRRESPRPAPMPTGRVGAVDFDGGYVTAGHGRTTVSVYFDFLCPICGSFEHANGESLHGLVSDGAITLRLHPMTFLDRNSSGTRYSTRAAAALVCVAASGERPALAFFSSLYAHQPAEGSRGLDDRTLARLAEKAGAADASRCIADGRYRDWVDSLSEHAVSGPIEGAEIDSVQGTPTVLVDGRRFTGDPTASGPLEDFIRQVAQRTPPPAAS